MQAHTKYPIFLFPDIVWLHESGELTPIPPQLFIQSAPVAMIDPKLRVPAVFENAVDGGSGVEHCSFENVAPF